MAVVLFKGSFRTGRLRSHSGSGFCRLTQACAIFFEMLRAVVIASSAPEAAMACPVMAFVELTRVSHTRRPITVWRALASVGSFSRVEVP